MGRYRCGPSVIRDPRGKAIGFPGAVFAHVFEPGPEAALIASGAVERIDSAEIYEADWLAAGYVEPPPVVEPKQPTTLEAVVDNIEE